MHAVTAYEQEQTRAAPVSRPTGAALGGRTVFYFDFLDFLVDSLTVALGLRFTVVCLTNRPVIALRPRLPPLDLLAMTVS